MSVQEQYPDSFAPWDVGASYVHAGDAEAKTDLRVYLEEVAAMFGPVEVYIEDDGENEAWTILLDVDRCPAEALPYLAQYVGERLPSGLSEAAARQWIKDAPNQQRGTVASIVDAARRRLTGTQLVTVIERDGGADKLSVITYTDQTPSSAAVLAELNKVVPADISLTYTVTAGQTWAQLQAANATWAVVQSTYATWADAQAARPSGTF